MERGATDVASLVIRHARRMDAQGVVDVAIRDGRIVAVGPDLASAEEEIDAEGALLTPAFVDPHVHLDAVLTAGFPHVNESGTLLEGIERWAERKTHLTEADVRRRAEEAVRWHVAHGVLKIRTHVDVCDDRLVALRAMLQVREAVRPIADLQIVAFPQDGIYTGPDGERLMEEAVRLGADVVGGIPHHEWTREEGIRDVEFAFSLAERYDRLVDIHCDETDDDQSRFLETVARLTLERGWVGRVVASHATAMGSYNNAYAFKLIRLLKRAGVQIIANPLDNIVLQGRFDTYPKRRGLTRVKELLSAGVNVAAGHDSIMDPWYPLGTGSPLFVASMLLHVAQMTGVMEMGEAFAAVTARAARAMQVQGYGLNPGDRADLVLLDAADPVEAIRRLAVARLVLRNGRVVARTEPARHEVRWGEGFQAVDFRSPAEPGRP